MRRENLEHIIRAAGAISGAKRLIVLGSQAILGMFPEPPAELTISLEADLYPPDDPEKADLIDGSIGELSPFHKEFGYYAHGVGPETAILPSQWESRLVAVQNKNTGNVIGLCLHPADIAASKLIAGREKVNYVRGLIRHKLLSTTDIENVVAELSTDHAKLAHSRLARLTRSVDEI